MPRMLRVAVEGTNSSVQYIDATDIGASHRCLGYVLIMQLI